MALMRLLLNHGRKFMLSNNLNRVTWTSLSSYNSFSTQPQPKANAPFPNRDKLNLDFNDPEQAYRSKSNWEIFRAYFVFKLCAINFIVDNNEKIMKISKKILGKTLFEKVMGATIYGHFVAGADQVSIQPNVQRLREFGIKAILDYSVEEDLSHDEAQKCEKESWNPMAENNATIILPPDPAADDFKKYRYHDGSADMRRQAGDRVYFYMNEAQCEKNMDIFLQSIKAVADATGGSGFAAIKITALGRPQLLLQLSEAIARVHRYVGEVTGKKGKTVEQCVKPEDFKRRLEKATKMDPTVQSWLNNMTFDSSGLLHVLPWKGLVEAKQSLGDTLKVVDLNTGKLQNLVPPLSNREEEMFKNMMRRLHTIFQVASSLDIRVMVDAEQTYFQPAIARLTMEMMRNYNQEKAIVFNTYQCYLKNAYRYFIADLEKAERQNFCFGAKLVRGAYMEQERARAALVGYDDPINENFEATTAMYNKCFEEGMIRMKKWKGKGQGKKIVLMAATHNEETVKFVVRKMKEHGIKRPDRLISFGQLYGMCDQISFPLGQSGYSVYKYVPYGPITEVLPYLSRRVQENRGLLGKTKKERALLMKEFLRRIFTGRWFYKPKGNYKAID